MLLLKCIYYLNDFYTLKFLNYEIRNYFEQLGMRKVTLIMNQNEKYIKD